MGGKLNEKTSPATAHTAGYFRRMDAGFFIPNKNKTNQSHSGFPTSFDECAGVVDMIAPAFAKIRFVLFLVGMRNENNPTSVFDNHIPPSYNSFNKYFFLSSFALLSLEKIFFIDKLSSDYFRFV